MKDVEIIKARNVLSSRARTNLAKRLRVAAYCRVSTDSEDQLNSYKSQVQHYTDLIKSKSEWDLAGIYADEAITGTQVTKREDFQRLINDCMNGDVDMIITKSISRFARNTLDTLKYVRMLKEKGIAVFFEEENINTLTMDGELLLVILSSVAQQEVENISANVKKGLKMKMQRGELVGFQGCLGYDYHPEDKSISVNASAVEQAVDAAAPSGSEPGLVAVDTDGLYAFLQAQLGDAMTADCLNKVMANRLPTRITALAGQSGDKLVPTDLTLKKRAGAENCYDFSAALLTATDSTAAAQVSGTITMVKEDGRWKAAAITLNL